MQRVITKLLNFILFVLIFHFTNAFAAPNDGSISDPNFRYIGRWDMASPTTKKSYWPGAYVKISFTGKTVAIKLANSSDFYVSIDNGKDVYYTNRIGTINLTPTPLQNGVHSIRVTKADERGSLEFQGLVLDQGAITSPPELSRDTVEFVGASIMAGYNTSKKVLTSSGWMAGEMLGVEHTNIAYSGMCLTNNCSKDNYIGLVSAFFKLNKANINSPNWGFSTYQPKAVVINIGSNDHWNSVSASTFQTAYAKLLTDMRAKYPDAKIYVLRLFTGWFAKESKAAVDLRNNLGDKNVYFVDTNDWTEKRDFSDGTHPTDEGNKKIAGKLVELLQPLFPKSTKFQTSFESNDIPLTWSDKVDYSANVIGYLSYLPGMESSPRSEGYSHSGSSALMYSGHDYNNVKSYSYNKLYEVNIPVTFTTKLSYWIYPQDTRNLNSTYVAIDLIFSDGTALRNLRARDQNGINMHPLSQGLYGNRRLNSWNFVSSIIGKVAAGKTIKQINIGFDQPEKIGPYRGYLDDLVIE